MNIEDLKRVLVSFADNNTDVIIERGKVFAEIRGEIIEAQLLQKANELTIKEDNVEYPIAQWIIDRIANLHTLAERILDYIPEEPYFIDPNGKLLDELNANPKEDDKTIYNVSQNILPVLGRQIPGTTNAIYITSDAGEGKTTLINQISRIQAKNFKDKKSNWLLIPIPLGGRPFLRFDDIVIASLVNKLRFRLFYYESFIELVKLGLIVPAFDGFEEMFMESNANEALTATGQLMNSLNSSGNVIISARKAYFDYKSFSSQAKLFDTIGGNSVVFARLQLLRWDKSQFIAYAMKRKIYNGEKIYEAVHQKLLSSEHPILTRAVLVKQLLTIFSESKNNIDEISEKFNATTNYFPLFVDGIIEREANYKWIDKTGSPNKPLLTIEQHYELLGLLSEEMWINNSESLHENVLELLTDLFTESNNLPINIGRQVKERIKQHALIIRPDKNNPLYKFDHEEFREFFLGVTIGDKIIKNEIASLKNLLRKGIIPRQTSESLASWLSKKVVSTDKILELLNSIMEGEGQTSFIKENNGTISIQVLNNATNKNTFLTSFLFPANALYALNISNIEFKDCYFQGTSLEGTTLSNCSFVHCTIERIDLYESTKITNTMIKESEILCLHNQSDDSYYYAPDQIDFELKKINFILPDETTGESENEEIIDKKLQITEKALRRFIRATYLNDNIFKMRLGCDADYFFKNILPELLDKGILEEVDYLGSGSKRRFKLGIHLSELNSALVNSKGSYEKFIETL